MPCSINALPTEVLDSIAYYLDVSDTGVLRLSCHAINNKLLQTRYVAHFKYKTIQLSQPALQRFIQVTNKNSLGCLLESCTIVGLAQLSAVSAQESERQKKLLAIAFGNLTQFTQHKSLGSLTLQIRGGDQDANGRFIESKEFQSRRAVWDAASRTFATAMEALNVSQLAVSHGLSLFTEQKGCSLVLDDFISMLVQPESFTAFQGLEWLKASFSVSPEVLPDTLSPNTEVQPRLIYPDSILHNITKVIAKTMPVLESADIHWYHVGRRRLPFPGQETDTSKQKDLFTTRLKECTLSGLYVTETDLLGFLNTTKPKTLSLKHIHIISGQWAPVLEQLTSPESGITSYYIDDVFQSTSLLHFNEPGTPKYPYKNREHWPSSLARESNLVREIIQHRIPSGRVLGSPQRQRWLRENAAKYGPCKGLYDFIKLNTPPDIIDTSDSAEE